MLRKLSILIVSVASLPLVSSAEELLRNDFNQPEALANWKSFAPDSTPNAKLYSGFLRGERSESRGLTALSRNFASPQDRIAVEFSLAFSEGAQRVFHIWSQEPDGKDASQLNLSVQYHSLQHFDGRSKSWEVVSKNVKPSPDVDHPIWHRIRVVIDSKSGGATVFLSNPGEAILPKDPTATVAVYRTDLPIAGISFVSGTRIAKDAWYLVDDLVVTGGIALPEPGAAPALLPEPFQLWSGDPIPADPRRISFAEGIEHRVIYQPDVDGYKFLHGAAIVEHDGIFYANWANSPVNENGPHETMQGKRSKDEGKTWSTVEIIGPGFEGPDRHSHGVLFVHKGEIWTIAARFGVGAEESRFLGLQGEAFVLNQKTDRWESRGTVMRDCWPYDAPVIMENGNFITGGQDKDGLPVVAISDGENFLKWESVKIPYPRKLAPIYAETTVWAEGSQVTAVIRGGGGVAWVATSDDCGKTWEDAKPSNFPMTRAKAYLGKLSTGQLYLLSNLKNRDTLCVSVGKPDAPTLSQIFRLRHGKSEPPRFAGKAKFKQWSYPYGFEHDGKLYVVYSIGKEECGLTVVPISALAIK